MQNINFIVEPDDHRDSPRDWDNLGVMVCSHRNYILGDEQFNSSDYSGWRELKSHLIKEEGAAVILPLYLYDHSGITMYTDGDGAYRQHEAWDSGQVGFIYATKETVRREYGTAGKDNLAKAEQVLRSEIKTYDQYLRGDVWHVTAVNEDGEHVDSLSGLYGDEGVEEFKKEVLATIDN